MYKHYIYEQLHSWLSHFFPTFKVSHMPKELNIYLAFFDFFYFIFFFTLNSFLVFHLQPVLLSL